MRIFISLLCSLSFLSAMSQDTSNYELLWQIKHKNSEKVSYLFGTMHLKDVRVFNFSDAVLPAISNSESFAIEVHPDSSISKAMQGRKSRVVSNYTEKFSNSEIEKLKERVSEKNGDSLANVDELSVDLLEQIMAPNYSKNTDRETFLDAYLYGVARFQDKEIHGLESAESQFSLRQRDRTFEDETTIARIIYEDDYAESQVDLREQLIALYETGNLARIHQLIDEWGGIDEIMVNRNKFMLSSMVKIMDEKTLFAAVGAAHLLGKDGLINLLRLNGYNVTPVTATFKNGGATQQNIDGTKLWKEQLFKEKGYGVKMPSNLSDSDEQGFSEMISGYDLISGVSVIHSGIDLSVYRKEHKDTLLTVLKSKYKNLISNATFEETVENDNRTLFFTGQLANAQVAMKIVQSPSHMYMFCVEYNQHPHSVNAKNYFFENITLFEPEKEAVVWDKLAMPVAGFEVLFPVKYNDLSRSVPDPSYLDIGDIELNLFQAYDPVKKRQFLMRYNDYPLGYHLEDNTTAIETYLNAMENAGHVVLSKNEVTENGILKGNMILKLSDNQLARAVIYMKGNRTYLQLMSLFDPDATEEDLNHEFFTSFKFTPLKAPEFEDLTTADSAFTIQFPKSRFQETTQLENAAYYVSETTAKGLDDNSGDVFMVNSNRMGPYYKINDKDDVLEEFFEEWKGPNDSLIHQQYFSKNGISGKEKLYLSTKSALNKKVRIAFHNNYLIQAASFTNNTQDDKLIEEQFFNSLTPNETMPFDLYEDKASLIFKHLKSRDTTIYNSAVQGMIGYEFNSSHKKNLLRIGQKPHKTDTLYNGQRNMALMSLALLKDDSIIPVLESVYKGKNVHESQLYTVLKGLTLINSKQAAKSYFKLLDYKLPNSENYYETILNWENDSLFDLKTNYHEILSLYNQEVVRDYVLDYYNRKIRADSTSIDLLKKDKDLFLSNLMSQATYLMDTTLVRPKSYSERTIYSSLELIKNLKYHDKSLQRLTEQLLTNNQIMADFKHSAFQYYVEHTANLDNRLLTVYMEPLLYRFEAMQELVKHGYANLIPPSYLEQQEFEKLAAYFYVYEDEGTEEFTLEKLGGVMIQGKEYSCYSSKFNYYEDESKYLVMVERKDITLDDLMLPQVYLPYEVVTDDTWENIATTYIQNMED